MVDPTGSRPERFSVWLGATLTLALVASVAGELLRCAGLR
jgi:hypothetical protein